MSHKVKKDEKKRANRGPTFCGIFTRKGPTKKEVLERSRKKHKSATENFSAF